MQPRPRQAVVVTDLADLQSLQYDAATKLSLLHCLARRIHVAIGFAVNNGNRGKRFS